MRFVKQNNKKYFKIQIMKTQIQKSVWLLALTLLVSSSVSAANHGRAKHYLGHDIYHFVYVGGSAGYNSMFVNEKNLTPSGSVAGQLGLGYEFRWSGFWINVGATLQGMSPARLTVADYQYTCSGYDEMGRPLRELTYTIDERDQVKFYTVGIPLMLGYYKEGFYIGAGAKLNYAVAGTASVHGSFSLHGEYENFVGNWFDTHAYSNYPISEPSQSMKVAPHASVVLEMGYDLLSMMPTRSRTCQVLKLGVVAEFGVTSLYEGKEGATHIVFPGAEEGYDATKIHVRPYYGNGMSPEQRVLPYYTGLKLTYMLGGSRTGGTATFHRGCQCYDN